MPSYLTYFATCTSTPYDLLHVLEYTLRLYLNMFPPMIHGSPPIDIKLVPSQGGHEVVEKLIQDNAPGLFFFSIHSFIFLARTRE